MQQIPPNLRGSSETGVTQSRRNGVDKTWPPRRPAKTALTTRGPGETKPANKQIKATTRAQSYASNTQSTAVTTKSGYPVMDSWKCAPGLLDGTQPPTDEIGPPRHGNIALVHLTNLATHRYDEIGRSCHGNTPWNHLMEPGHSPLR